MEFWSELSKKISDAADYTAKETGKLTNIAKIKYKISGLKSKRDLLFKNIGKMKFAEYCGESFDETSYNEMLEEIVKTKAEIEELEENIAELKNYKICPICKTKIDRDMLFCPRCGAKQEVYTSDEAADESEDTDETESEIKFVDAGFDATNNVSDAENELENKDRTEKF